MGTSTHASSTPLPTTAPTTNDELEEATDTHRGQLEWTKARIFLQQAEQWAGNSHNRLPGIRKIPLRAIGIILFIALLNAVVWIAAGIVVV